MVKTILINPICPLNCIFTKSTQPQKFRVKSVRVWSYEQELSPKQQHVIITGANTGIGFETAKAMAKKGYSTTLACRDLGRARAAKIKILQETPGADVELLELKLDNLQSVSDATKKLLDSEKDIHVLINNAGVMGCSEMQTDDGFEYQLGVNHFGHFLFTYGLLPKLRKPDQKTRIVNVSSAAHVFAKIDFDDLNYKKTKYDSWGAYCRSKLANILFTYELAKRLRADDNCTVNCLHPGLVATELGRYIFSKDKGPAYVCMLRVIQLFCIKPKEGAQTSVFLASSQQVENETSKYYKQCKEAASSPLSYDESLQKKLWEISVEQTKSLQFTDTVL